MLTGGLVGRTPWSARVPLDPLFDRETGHPPEGKGRPGAGRGPGVPPYQARSLAHAS
jgi:hypothetical protein